MRLRTKYALILLAILIVLGTVVGGSAELFKQQTIEQEQAELDETANLSAGQIDESLGDSENLLRGYVSEIHDVEAANDTIYRMLNNSHFFAALVVDTNETIVDLYGDVNAEERANATGDSVTEHDYVDPAVVRRGLDFRVNGIANISSETIEATNQTIVTFTLPIPNPEQENESIGVLVASTFFENSNYGRSLTPLESGNSQTARLTTTGETGETVLLRKSDNEFDNALVGTATVESTGWTVVLERDRSALTSRIQFLQFIQLGSLAIVLLSVFGLGYYEYRTTLRQTDKLLEGFSEMTDGNFEYSLSLGSAEEWTQIGEGFNTMADGMREREQQIRERERRLSVLNRVLRHNLQNDLTVVQGYAEVLPTMDEKEQREDASETILRKSRGLVNHGRKARRLETVMENAEEGTTELELGGKVMDTVREYERDFEDVTVESEGPEEAWVDAVSGIEFGIEQLVDNAFEHNTSDDPTVTVTVEDTGEEVIVTVEDNGPGIPEHEREVLVQDEETSLEHGSGIGLWLAYWAVVKSGGELEFGEQANGGHVTARLQSCEPPDDADTGDLLDF